MSHLKEVEGVEKTRVQGPLGVGVPRGLFFVLYVRRAIVFSLKTQGSTGITYYPVRIVSFKTPVVERVIKIGVIEWE